MRMKAILIPTSNENCLFRIKKMTLEWSAYSENVHCMVTLIIISPTKITVKM